MFHVFKIQPQARFKGRIPARLDLPEPRYAGFYFQSSVIIGTVSHVIVYGMGARTNQAHIAFQDIPKLGKLIEAVLAKKSAEPGDARVISNLEERVSPLVESAQRFFQLVSPINHSPELITNKFSSLFPRAEGAINDRAR